MCRPNHRSLNLRLDLLKTKPASLTKSKSQLIKQGVSQFLSRWIELNKCVDTVIVRREQLEDPSNILQYMKITDDERRTSSQMETIQQHIQNCIKSNDRPKNINALIDSWLKVKDLTMACFKENLILLEHMMAARKRKDLQQFSLKAKNILQA